MGTYDSRWVDGAGYQLLVNSARRLKADVILVLGQDKLQAELEREFRKDGNKVSRVKSDASHFNLIYSINTLFFCVCHLESS